MAYDKLIRDGKVAVLVSPGFGAGWQSWAGVGEPGQVCMDKRIVEAFLAEGYKGAERVVKELFEHMFTGGAADLEVEWVPEGTSFEIHEYDGSETLQYADRDWLVA